MFMVLLPQVSRAVNLCTSRSLVLMDEFGKGTATVSKHCLLSYTCTCEIEFEACTCVMVYTGQGMREDQCKCFSQNVNACVAFNTHVAFS